MYRVVLLTFATAVFACTALAVSFDPPQVYPLISTPAFLRAADFDGDGDIDLAVRVSDDPLPERDPNAGISVLFNNGDGTYGDPVNYVTGDYIAGFCAADLDGDGDIDMASIERTHFFELSVQDPDSLTIWINDGSGVFAISSTQEIVTKSALSPAAVDIDGDGDNDLMIAGFSNDTICVMKNDGAGCFTPDTAFETDHNPAVVCPGDLDGDGDVDLAVGMCWGENGSLLIYLSDGDGQFTLNHYGDNYRDYSSVFATDVDGDGDTDLIATGQEGYFWVFKNLGDGSFAEVEFYGVIGTLFRAVAVDFDSDGDDDLALSYLGADTVAIWANNGDGTFSFDSKHTVASYPTWMAAEDLDGDGDIDLSVVSNWEHSVSVLLNTTLESGVDDESHPGELPEEFRLAQNHPNPFNPSTTFEFALPCNSNVSVEIYNATGQRVRLLLDEQRSAGTHVVTWEGCDDSGSRVATGVYFYRLVTDEFTESKKMILLK